MVNVFLIEIIKNLEHLETLHCINAGATSNFIQTL